MAKMKIGIAFGSGVARGWAHIGVIKGLVKAGYNPDIISGTSIGALVGASFAAGKLEQIEEFALKFHGRRLITLLDLRLGGAGLIGGKRLARLMEEHLGDVQIEHLSRTFVAVATELATGHEAWLRKGPIVDAVRASYALPGLFEPVWHEERWLIDGALVNPIPVSVCRALGARLVIAVNLNNDAIGLSNHFDGHMVETIHADIHDTKWKRRLTESNRKTQSVTRQFFGTKKQSPGLTNVMMGALNIMQDRMARSRLAADPADVLIAPDVGHIGLIDFDKAEELIAQGEAAAAHAIPFVEHALTRLNGRPDENEDQPVAI
ncbi:patatin-like phospholipase family protein [Parvibaculum lavamentivorans]|nr:patatin-like phospholipase family protein [Parvibaculum lavamentivorans]